MSKIRSQRIFIFFNGEGFRIVRDEYFYTPIGLMRKDVNVPRSKVDKLIEVLASDLQVEPKEMFELKPFRTIRRLGILSRTYEVQAHIVYVPDSTRLSTRSTTTIQSHELYSLLEPLIVQFQSQLSVEQEEAKASA